MSTSKRDSIPIESRPVLAIILISFAMIVIDNSIVFTGLSQIQAELGFTDEGLSWISTIYALFFGGFLLVGARAGDLLGRRRIFSVGLIVFSLASLAICFAPTPSLLVIARAIQGIGSAIIAPSTLALLQAEFPPGEARTKAISYYAATGGVSASVGLVIGGIFAGWLSWRIGFFINVPIGLALVFALKRFAHDNEGKPGRLDLVGAVTSTIAIGLLLIAIDRSVSAGWGDTFTIASLVGSAVLLVLFIYIQARVELPLMPLRLFASVERSGAYAARLLFIGANMAFYFYISQFMQGVLGVNAAFAGVAFLPSTIVNFITAMVVARFIIRFGSAPVLIVTVTCGLLGMATLSFVSPTSTYWAALLIPTMLVGIGQGGSLAPLTTAALADVAKEDAGAASGIINVAHQMGASLGIGVATSYAASVDTSLSGAGLMTERVHLAMSAASVMVFLSLVMVLAIIMQRRKRGARQKL